MREGSEASGRPADALQALADDDGDRYAQAAHHSGTAATAAVRHFRPDRSFQPALNLLLALLAAGQLHRECLRRPVAQEHAHVGDGGAGAQLRGARVARACGWRSSWAACRRRPGA
jgi:hypothetical protein